MKKIFFFFPLFLAASCSDPDAVVQEQKPFAGKIALVNDAEKEQGWINENYLEESPNAHSGKRVSVTDKSRPYSLGLKTPLDSIFSGKVGSVTIGAWICSDSIPESEELALVASVNTKEKSIFWHGEPVKEQLTEAKKWIYVSGTIKLGYEAAPGLEFAGYLINETGNRILVDDLSFTFNP
jgi:hypothetical protein